MASQLLGYSGKPADYTVTIANQKGDLFVYPEHGEDEDGWRVFTGILIQFVNTTGESIRVTVTPDVYQGANPFTVAPASRTICTVLLTQQFTNESNGKITHEFKTVDWSTADGPRVATGGPKMVPTEPKED